MRPPPPAETTDWPGALPEHDPWALASLARADLQRRWLAGRPAAVEQYLERLPGLGSHQDAVLDLLLAEFSARDQAGCPADLADYERRFPDLAARLRQRHALHQRLLSDDGLIGPGPPSPRPGAPQAPTGTLVQPQAPHATPATPTGTRVQEGAPASPAAEATGPYVPVPGGRAGATDLGGTGRYQVIRPHAKGGLGQVSVAVDRELGREVAFKEIQPQYAHDSHSRHRFVREARLTGRLEHPGIVPVYGLGRREDGQPYYAMRFIQGSSLKDATNELHASPSPEAERGRAFRQLLRRFVDACNAVAYAHSRGVLHRDLKPANIMLGPFGETLVVDWGLAKETGESGRGGAEGAASASEPTEGGEALTREGGMAGTPAYMSPEQSEGRWKDVGPRSDVYCLGATLYVLLTGKTPFSGSVAQILPQLQAGRFPRPRAVSPSVPKALEAVCLKAMARDPADRYPTALALAEDVDRWLNDDPVSAYREPWTKKLARWGRRHQKTVTGATALVGTSVVALIVGLIFVSQAWAQTDTQRREANRRFSQARGAVDRFLLAVSEDERLKAAHLQSLRRELLESGLEYYQEFLATRGEAPGLREREAYAHLRMADIHADLGDVLTAREAYGRAFALYRDLVAEQPGEVALQMELASGHQRLGDLLTAGKDTRADGHESYRQALALLGPLSADNPGAPEVQSALARVYRGLAAWHKVERAPDALAYSVRKK